MAANKFATMLHKNTNKLTLVLIYAVLEWTLILLLLLNSIFSYVIVKFAQYFGLNPPCFWCARIDRFFEPETPNSHRDRLCEIHSKEVSHLGFCSIHKKLAESHDMCEDCSSSNLGFRKESKNFVFSKVKRIEMVQIDEVNLKCSCCGVDFERKLIDDSSSFVIHPSWDILDYAKKMNPIDDHIEELVADDGIGSDYFEEHKEENVDDEEHETEELEIEVIRDSNSFEDDLIQFEKRKDLLNSHDLQFFIDYSGNQLFPFELVDSKTEENGNSFEAEDHEFGDFQEAQMNSEEFDHPVYQNLEELSTFCEKSLVSHENLGDFIEEQVAIAQETRTPSLDTEELEEIDSEIHSVHEEEEVSIGTEIPVLDSCDEIKHEEPSTNLNLENDSKEAREEANAGESKKLSENVDEIEEEKIPTTPSSIHSSNNLHKKWLVFDSKDSRVEESFDGSVISEPDGGDPVNTAEKLKLALKAERKALHELYSELEEERSASAVAASETMAMINRLQEEKAAVQMEALQYQRMMEEQSEYDQEALQLLNELMMKREKELELYRKKVSDYEAKERTRFSRRCKHGSSKTGTCSASWSHSEDDDGFSVDLNQEHKEGDNFVGNRESHHQNIQNTLNIQNTVVDSVLDLESSLADFEEERVSILEQLKVLEEKLFALSDEEDRHFANIRVVEDHYEEMGSYGFDGQNVECATNGLVRYGKQLANKKLLPLFDAISTGSEDGVPSSNGYQNGFHSNTLEDTTVTRFELEKKRIDMEEEVDQLYGRLQALEADREFLKHCIGSLNKGDKGMELLQEILQHLRDLRNVNLRTQGYTDNALV